MEKTCRLVHITYRENNRGPGREEYNTREYMTPCVHSTHQSNIYLHSCQAYNIINGTLIIKHIYVCMYTYMYIYVYIYMYVCIYIYIYIYIYKHIEA